MRTNFGKRSEFDRSIETCSHLPKSEVVDISLILLRKSIKVNSVRLFHHLANNKDVTEISEVEVYSGYLAVVESGGK